MNPLIAKYRKLIKAPESVHALDEAVVLIERATGLLIRLRGTAIVVGASAKWSPPDRSWKPLRALVETDETGRRPRMRAGRGQPQDRNRLVRVLWCLGALPRHLSAKGLPESQRSFVLDALLLLFHQAYFALLPRLTAGADRRDLISCFFTFAESLPDIAERFRVVGLAYHAKGDVASTLTSFERALRASHVDEHVFMTRLQTLWTTLLEHGNFKAALELLLEMMPTMPLKHLPELRELIAVTFDEYGEACLQRRAAG